MPRPISSPLQIARMMLASGQAWLLFVEIPASGGGYFRLVKNSRHVQADGKIWQAAAIAIELPEEQADGALGEMSLTIPNVSRLPGLLIEQGEILGRDIQVWLQHESALTSFDGNLTWKHRVLKADVDEGAVRVTAGHPAGFLRIPKGVYTRVEFPQLLATGGVRS